VLNTGGQHDDQQGHCVIASGHARPKNGGGQGAGDTGNEKEPEAQVRIGNQETHGVGHQGQ
jgi:hypothetical protein